MTISRRTVLKAGAASGALLLARPALAGPLGPREEFSTSRRSRLFPGTRLVHADLHNHTLFSDGAGDPAKAFASMRAAGLDVAALTDHSTVGKVLGGLDGPCSGGACDGAEGITEPRWAATERLAEEANRDHSFAAIRGFEWSSPTLGHVNVWFSQDWVDPLSTVGNTTGEGLAQYLHDVPGLGPAISPAVDAAVRAIPTRGAGMRPFYDWLDRPPAAPSMAGALISGGRDGIAGFNHPGREPGRFSYFAYDARLVDRIVSMEVFNRGEDFLFEGTDAGARSPIVECLDAGWRVGLIGVTDEHGSDWGYPDGKGRAGLYVRELTRAGVREAMTARRFYSTRLRGLRFGAAANGKQMGSLVRHTKGAMRFSVDVDRGRSMVGKRVEVQVLMTGSPLPTVVHTQRIKVPASGELVSFSAPVDIANGRWVVLRLTDPAEKADARAPTAYSAAGNAIAYAAPFFLAP
ncbi:MAG TPA: hypothetical protein VNB94_03495 [Mycobacteriales bacterium]|nr:hypothetical protein [Mycobacteriales bacterium]